MLSSDHPIDLTRYQLANCYMGRAGLINSGGASAGESDLKEAVKTSVINKRAGGMGLISGRKAFQRPMKEGVGAAERDPGRLLGQAHHRRVRLDGRRWRWRRRSLIAGSLQLTRPGYSVDEEFTVFAVRGIQRTAFRSCLPAFSTIAASRIRTRAGSPAPSPDRSCRPIARSAWSAPRLIVVAHLPPGQRARRPVNAASSRRCWWRHRFRSGRRRRAARFYAPFLAAYLRRLLALTHPAHSCTRALCAPSRSALAR